MNDNPLSPTTLKAILFDVDGTLIQSADLYYEMLSTACQNLGLAVPTLDLIIDCTNQGKDYYSFILNAEQHKDRASWKQKLQQQFESLWEPIFHQKVQCILGVDSLLEELRLKGYRLGIVTSSLEKVFAPLEQKGLLEFFDVIITRADVKQIKPHPEPINLALERLGVSAEEAVMIGDTPLDLQSGSAAGTKTIAVLTGNANLSLLEKYGPDAIIPDVTYLPDLLGHQFSYLTLTGIVVSGLQVARDFTQITWFQEQVKEHLGYSPYPGTLNLILNDDGNQTILQQMMEGGIRSNKAFRIIPAPGFCDAYCLPVKMEANAKMVDCAIIYPMVPDYPKEKLEIISAMPLKDTFNISNGDQVRICGWV